jgi:hypothetical protein
LQSYQANTISTAAEKIATTTAAPPPSQQQQHQQKHIEFTIFCFSVFPAHSHACIMPRYQLTAITTAAWKLPPP